MKFSFENLEDISFMPNDHLSIAVQFLVEIQKKKKTIAIKMIASNILRSEIRHYLLREEKIR